MAWIANTYSKYRARDLRTTFENSKTRQNSSPKSSTWKETERESKRKTVVRTSNNFTSPPPTRTDKKAQATRERERESLDATTTRFCREFHCHARKDISPFSLSNLVPSPRWRSEKKKERSGRKETEKERGRGKNRSGKETKNSTLNHNYIVRSSTLLNWVVSIFCAASDATAVKMNKREKKSGSDVRKTDVNYSHSSLFNSPPPPPSTLYHWRDSNGTRLSLFISISFYLSVRLSRPPCYYSNADCFRLIDTLLCKRDRQPDLTQLTTPLITKIPLCFGQEMFPSIISNNSQVIKVFLWSCYIGFHEK